MDDALVELAAVAAAVRAYLEAEQELKAPGIPVPTVAPLPALAPAPAVVPTRSNEPVRAATSADRPGPPPLVPEDKRQRLAILAQEAAACTACVLHEKRNKSVFARGNPDAELVFVGEGPGFEEDIQGFPFVGPAGQLLDRMIDAMGYARDEVYVCNIVKCRPPENRTPRPEEAIACARFLRPQLELVGPKMIVALGRCAAENLGVAEAAGPWRGRFGSWRGITVMPTYHPAYLLRSPEQKRVVWADLQQVMARLGRSRPSRSS